jgi:hypothetical protein
MHQEIALCEGSQLESPQLATPSIMHKALNTLQLSELPNAVNIICLALSWQELQLQDVLTSPDEHCLALEVSLGQITDALLGSINNNAAAARDAHLCWLGTSQTSLALNTHGQGHCAMFLNRQTQFNR